MEKDMTAGTPGKIIFNFTMPIFIGNIFQQFYNMADTVIVGKFVGNAAVSYTHLRGKAELCKAFTCFTER